MPKLVKKIIEPVLIGLTLLGGVVSLMTLYPRVTVTISFDAKDPLSSTFLVSNDGYLPVYSVSTYCLVGAVMTEPRQPSETEIAATSTFGTVLHRVDIPTLTLDPGAKELVTVSNCMNVASPAVLSFAHVGLRADYRPLLWPTTRSFTQELFVKSTGEGYYFWYSVPYTK
jgi:hypothetical protein